MSSLWLRGLGELIFPTGGCLLCWANLEESCTLEQCGWLQDAADKVGVLRSTSVFHSLAGHQGYNFIYYFIKDVFGLTGNKSIPTHGTAPSCIRLTHQGQESRTIKSEGSGTNCPVLPWTGHEILGQLLNFSSVTQVSLSVKWGE